MTPTKTKSNLLDVISPFDDIDYEEVAITIKLDKKVVDLLDSLNDTYYCTTHDMIVGEINNLFIKIENSIKAQPLDFKKYKPTKH